MYSLCINFKHYDIEHSCIWLQFSSGWRMIRCCLIPQVLSQSVRRKRKQYALKISQKFLFSFSILFVNFLLEHFL